MKRYLILIVLLCVVSAADGANFSYYAGGFRAFCEVDANDTMICGATPKVILFAYKRSLLPMQLQTMPRLTHPAGDMDEPKTLKLTAYTIELCRMKAKKSATM
ncbi:MAG: hypothetical protein ACYS6W_02340 [Planctomycetota bacterium]